MSLSLLFMYSGNSSRYSFLRCAIKFSHAFSIDLSALSKSVYAIAWFMLFVAMLSSVLISDSEKSNFRVGDSLACSLNLNVSWYSKGVMTISSASVALLFFFVFLFHCIQLYLCFRFCQQKNRIFFVDFAK